LVSVLLLAGPARAAPLVADLSDHLVAITAGFAGADVLMFGAVEESGDVVMIVKGPSERVSMHRKSWIGGIWINTATMTFKEVPSFYAIASSRPLEEIASETLLARNEMGVERLKLELPRAKASPNLAQEWRRALVRNKQRDGLYSKEVEKISFLGERLFRSRVQFPANVPTGTYRVDVFLLKDDRVISAQTRTKCPLRDHCDFRGTDGRMVGPRRVPEEVSPSCPRSRARYPTGFSWWSWTIRRKWPWPCALPAGGRATPVGAWRCSMWSRIPISSIGWRSVT
jgi:uncharacterized protein (TIGR02186 family)